ncbi:MAG: hypothetical protein QOE27_1189 [Solirubrobacteraceae bacterium]|jgi:hypothetical protein|nr:hypothetical protein [Solirubrobacteraceae bacterium]MEA2301195.1 hypothetical protein [Solirubrobacteraceae bacterium]
MGLVLVTTFGMIMWIILWALGSKGLDAFLVAAFVILLGATGRILTRYLPGRARRE